MLHLVTEGFCLIYEDFFVLRRVFFLGGGEDGGGDAQLNGVLLFMSFYR